MSAVRAALRGLGELLITAGVVLLLFCVYQLVWTNLEAQQAQNRVTDTIRDDWRRPAPRPSADGTQELPLLADFGDGFAFLRIPRLGQDFLVPVVEGVRADDLARGVGHYPRTAGPGAVGNFAVAGHRATHGEPFRNLDRMRRGDPVVVETRGAWFTYIVDDIRIVDPTDVWVVDPVPGHPDAQPIDRLLTLTTCNPRWASTQRLIIFGHLESKRAKAEGPPPVLTAKGV